MTMDPQTYTFKVAGNCEIQADVYRISDPVTQPVLVWIHGGALIMGCRSSIPPDQLERYVATGHTLVSIDYRLAPETKLNAIIEDVGDACRWVRERGPDLFHGDPDRMAVIGHSAGGYLTLMAGFCVNPRPRALVAFYGYGDIAGSWYSRPDPFYGRQPPVSREEAYQVVGGPVLSGTPGPHPRDRFYLYCRQQGRWPVEVTGYDPDTEPAAFDAFCPVRNVTPAYPPTLLLHGDRDTDVPYEQSVWMAEELDRVGIEHDLITIPKGGHGFDGAGIEEPLVGKAFERVVAFLERHIG